VIESPLGKARNHRYGIVDPEFLFLDELDGYGCRHGFGHRCDIDARFRSHGDTELVIGHPERTLDQHLSASQHEELPGQIPARDQRLRVRIDRPAYGGGGRWTAFRGPNRNGKRK